MINLTKAHIGVAAVLWFAAPAAAWSQSVTAIDTPTRDARSGARSNDASPTTASLAFWRALGDTTLDRLLNEALHANRDIEVARARVSGARAARAVSAFAFTPAVTAVSGYSRQRQANGTLPGGTIGDRLPEQDVWDAGLNLSWEVDVFGRLRHTMRARNALLSGAFEDLRDVQILLASQVASAYFEMRGEQERLVVAQRNAENQRGTLDVTLQRLEAGRGTALDTERARAQLSATLAVIPASEARIAAARYRISVLTGREPNAQAFDSDRNEHAFALPDSIAVGSLESMVRRRPDVRSAKRQADATSAFVRAAKAEYLPRLSLGGGAGYTSSRFDALGDAGTPRFAVGPVLSWPALDIGRVRANVSAARAVEVEATARYESAVLHSLEEMQTSLISYRKARERLQHLADAAAASERAEELARLRYTEGASDFLQVLDAGRTLLDAQDQLALGRIEASMALVAVYRALGGELLR